MHVAFPFRNPSPNSDCSAEVLVSNVSYSCRLSTLLFVPSSSACRVSRLFLGMLEPNALGRANKIPRLQKPYICLGCLLRQSPSSDTRSISQFLRNGHSYAWKATSLKPVDIRSVSRYRYGGVEQNIGTGAQDSRWYTRRYTSQGIASIARARVDGRKDNVVRAWTALPRMRIRRHPQMSWWHWTFSGERHLSKALLMSTGSHHSARKFHSGHFFHQQAAVATSPDEHALPPNSQNLPDHPPLDIRARLRKWQELNSDKEEEFRKEPSFQEDSEGGDVINSSQRIPESISRMRSSQSEMEEEREAQAHFMLNSAQDPDSTFDSRPLRMGDLVELERVLEDRESLIAVFLRRVRLGSQVHGSQFLTTDGRWVFRKERHIPFSIPGWAPPALVEPLLQHLPDMDELEERRIHEGVDFQDDNLSIARHISAPLVRKMVKFTSEYQEIYRKYASRLDNAHNELAHESDLRYGSLLSVAQRLFDKPAAKISSAALYAVRLAIARADFAFNFDRRSHRLTGYLQIRSKQQVKMITEVRDWIRDWQEDKAIRAAYKQQGNVKALRNHATRPTAQHIYSFIHKARNIIKESRKDRQPTLCGYISPSKKRFPLSENSEAVRKTVDTQFTEQETQIVRFMEGWNCSGIFTGLPRLEALPPLLLHAIGMYDESGFSTNDFKGTGWQFLQEIGTITPYENRIRYDEHLLLPSSQHSKPLQNLMNLVAGMENSSEFNDSMEGLRHDWAQLPVYCIDAATAQEIDDGISIERAGSNNWWVHVHVANPTAFMNREHPIAKMARHMGESLYMPERTYAMLPRWATVKHFSLGNDRPCLTFSFKLDGEGQMLEHKIRAGWIRNVIRLTPPEVQQMLGVEAKEKSPIVTLTVGGEAPSEWSRKKHVAKMDYENIQDLKTLHMLATKRLARRSENGGMIFSNDMLEVQVFQTALGPGLSWDHPYRKGRRGVEGDPIIQMQTRAPVTSFEASVDPSSLLVTEMMLLAGEVGGAWCAERQVPALFRGTARRPDAPDPEVFLREVVQPATEKYGAMPRHIAVEYMGALGSGRLGSRPIKHGVLGINTFCKVTSPLRRYGDMIMHWQIEAALREEARTGTSLVTIDSTIDRKFLPFSRIVLDTIMLGLAPRETMITRAKQYSNQFWASLLMFRAIHYDECALPFATPLYPDKPPMRTYAYAQPTDDRKPVTTLDMDLGMMVNMANPAKHGLGTLRLGDIWEVKVERVTPLRRAIDATPVRLLERLEM